jgi:hypothetical protein
MSNKKILNLTIKWICVWLFIAGGSIYWLPLMGADQLHKFYITSLYFLTFALAGIIYYQINIKSQLRFYILSALTISIICLLIESIFPIGEMTIQKIITSKFYFPLFRLETVISKTCDVLFQQIFILGLVNELKIHISSHRKIICIFSLCFYIIHIPLFFSFQFFYVLCFLIPSLVAGVMFSYLILNYRFGPTMSQILHLLFYLILGLYLRI